MRRVTNRLIIALPTFCIGSTLPVLWEVSTFLVKEWRGQYQHLGKKGPKQCLVTQPIGPSTDTCPQYCHSHLSPSLELYLSQRCIEERSNNCPHPDENRSRKIGYEATWRIIDHSWEQLQMARSLTRGRSRPGARLNATRKVECLSSCVRAGDAGR